MASREGGWAPVNVGLIAGVNQSNFYVKTVGNKGENVSKEKLLEARRTLKASGLSLARETRRIRAALAASETLHTSATPTVAGTTTRRDCSAW